jgi:hypothetical protein
VDRTHKILVVLSLPFLLVAATAAPSFFAAPASLCFTSGTATYQVSRTAAAPDYRIRIDNSTPRPDLRMQVVDRPEIADFVIADEFGAVERDACRSAIPLKTVKVDAGGAPDVVIALSTDSAAADYRIYVYSMRYSHQDAAALLAAMWKAGERRRLADPADQPFEFDELY